ncbi:hypothetical protein A0H81_12432 [Grifola frondosa]|uniref:Uncharacterized protein n=1 Tax=Grifola frondosa TaxID=5627 RepID=A0A1C7LTG5_GRIFR|nr:hypothetical protein A0H81_12432 [Grifola frondosa]
MQHSRCAILAGSVDARVIATRLALPSICAIAVPLRVDLMGKLEFHLSRIKYLKYLRWTSPNGSSISYGRTRDEEPDRNMQHWALRASESVLSTAKPESASHCGYATVSRIKYVPIYYPPLNF